MKCNHCGVPLAEIAQAEDGKTFTCRDEAPGPNGTLLFIEHYCRSDHPRAPVGWNFPIWQMRVIGLIPEGAASAQRVKVAADTARELALLLNEPGDRHPWPVVEG